MQLAAAIREMNRQLGSQVCSLTDEARAAAYYKVVTGSVGGLALYPKSSSPAGDCVECSRQLFAEFSSAPPLPSPIVISLVWMRVRASIPGAREISHAVVAVRPADPNNAADLGRLPASDHVMLFSECQGFRRVMPKRRWETQNCPRVWIEEPLVVDAAAAAAAARVEGRWTARVDAHLGLSVDEFH